MKPMTPAISSTFAANAAPLSPTAVRWHGCEDSLQLIGYAKALVPGTDV